LPNFGTVVPRTPWCSDILWTVKNGEDSIRVRQNQSCSYYPASVPLQNEDGEKKLFFITDRGSIRLNLFSIFEAFLVAQNRAPLHTVVEDGVIEVVDTGGPPVQTRSQISMAKKLSYR
jgi:hypothetical protein